MYGMSLLLLCIDCRHCSFVTVYVTVAVFFDDIASVTGRSSACRHLTQQRRLVKQKRVLEEITEAVIVVNVADAAITIK